MLRYIESCKGKCTKSMLATKFRKLKRNERKDILDNLTETNAIRIEVGQKSKSRQAIPYYAINKK